MRRGEICELRWENIDLRKKTAKLIDTKNGEDRKIPLSPKALQLLNSLPRNLSGRVFSMRTDSITQAFERCCKRAKIEDLRLRDLCSKKAMKVALMPCLSAIDAALILKK